MQRILQQMIPSQSATTASPYPNRPMSRSELLQFYKQYVRSQQSSRGNPHVEDKQGLRICSYNVHMEDPYANGVNEGRAHMKRVITELDADVICLQEVHEAQSLSDMPYVEFHKLFGSFGNAICSKLPLKDVTKHQYPTSLYEKRGLIGATISHPTHGDIRIYNTHLDVFDESGETRLRQTQAIARLLDLDKEQFNHTGPILLMGDFNAVHPASYQDPKHWGWILNQDRARSVPTSTSAMEHLFSTGWTDLFRADPPTVTTWSMRRIDYILAQAHQTLETTCKLRLWHHYDVASDHLPVGMDLIME